MLTKEHLKHRIRLNRVKPVFLSGTESETQLADRLIAIFEASPGQSRLEVEAALAQNAEPLVPAFCKLLWDRTKENEDDGSALEFRWQVFELAEGLRRNLPEAMSAAEFRQVVGERVGADDSVLAGRLYGDLAENKTVASFRNLTGEALVQRYNCAQIQGLLLHATSFTVDLEGTTLAERRVFFRQMKFRRLLALVESSPESEKLSVTLTGPLALFENSQAYGLRLAQFFPHILSLSRFKITAELRLKRRELTLVLDQKCGIKSHYKQQTSYVPPELKDCIEGFNAKYAEKLKVSAEPNTDFVHLGKQSYCFPDIKIETSGPTPQVYYIELFHRWHAHQLQQRVAAMASVTSLILGVSTQLAKGQSALAQAPHFTFREFPTPGQIKTYLADRMRLSN